MAGQLKVDSINADSNLTLRIANTAVAFIDSNGLRPSSGNVSLDATGTTGIRSPSANTLVFYEGGVEAMRIDSSGNVGIGTSSPAQKLDIGGSGNSIMRLVAAGQANGLELGQLTADGGNKVFATNNNYLAFGTNNTEAMRIDSSGNVGIGTTPSSWDAKLAVFNGNIALTTTTNKLYLYNTSATNFAHISTAADGSITFTNGTSSPTERMRIDSSGNMLVNTTSSTGHKMTVQSAAGAGGIDCVGGATNGYYAMRVDMPSTNTYGVLFRNNSNNVGDIRVNSSSTAYNTSSDYRLKENIAPMTGALATVSALKPVTYKWKSTGEESQGFIAHELAEVMPDCVTGEKDAVDAEGKPVYQGVDTSFLVATLTAAIQELKEIVDAQATEIAALKAK